MSGKNTEDLYLYLIRHLIELKGLSISKASEIMNVQRSNLSSWINGKHNVFSLSKIEGMLSALGMRALINNTTGIRLCYLSPETIHLWQVGVNNQPIIEFLQLTEQQSTLEWLEIFQIEATPKGRFNIIRKRDINGDLLILIANKDPTENSYPITEKSMGFGKVAGKLTIPLEKWIGWWKAKELSAKEFRKDLSLIISKSDLSDATNNDLENHNFEATIKKYNDSENTNAGLRAIIRELLKTLREAAPDNGLLIKENRDRIFNDYCRAEEKKLNDNS